MDESDARGSGGSRARRVIRIAKAPNSERIATSASLNSNECVAITLRDFRAGEFQLLWQLDQKCFPSGIAYTQRELKHYMEAPGTFTIVAEANGREAPNIAGFLVGQRHKRGLGHVVTIDVNPEFRREGVGTLMMEAAEQRLRSEGCQSIFLETAVDNESAISFYKRLGYTVLRTLPRYYMGDLDAFLMGKRLLDVPKNPKAKATR